MGHKLKGLGVSIVVVLAFGLIFTSIAGAAAFTAATYPAFFKGEATSAIGYVTTEGLKLECSSNSASATLSAASSTVTIVNGSATGCKGSFGTPATVNGGGCSALVHVTEGSGDTYFGSGDLLCPAGQSIVTVAGPCETKVFPQNGSVTVELINNTAEGSVEVKVKSSNFKYTVTKDGVTCPYNGTGEKTGGTLTQLKTGIVKIAGNKVNID